MSSKAIEVLGWELDDGLHLGVIDTNFNETSVSLYEEDVVQLAFELITSLKDKPKAQQDLMGEIQQAVLAEEANG